MNNDNDIREMLTLLALLSEPNNIDVYFDINNDGFNRRYYTYLKEIGTLNKIVKEKRYNIVFNGLL
ncbi:MAG: hypothetical protein ACXWFC_06430, partial [Nitrososphaeraceae archaeon]